MAEAAQKSTSGFERLRGLFRPEVADVAEKVIASGGLSLVEIQAIEFAEMMEVDKVQEGAIEAMAMGEKTSTLVAQLANVKLQSRKHLRAIAELLNPGVNPNKERPELPPELEVYNAADAGDYGDDLVN